MRSLEKNSQVSQSTIFIHYDDNFFFCALLFELLLYYSSVSLHHIIILYLKIYQQLHVIGRSWKCWLLQCSYGVLDGPSREKAGIANIGGYDERCCCFYTIILLVFIACSVGYQEQCLSYIRTCPPDLCGRKTFHGTVRDGSVIIYTMYVYYMYMYACIYVCMYVYI